MELRQQLESAEEPAPVIAELIRRTRSDLPLRRRVFLRQSYLYAERPLLALRLVQMLRLEHLFSEKHLWVERDGARHIVTRKQGRYIERRRPLDPLSEREAALLLWDRVGVVPAEGTNAAAENHAAQSEADPRLHLDLRRLARALGSSRIELTHRTTEGHVATIGYEGDFGRHQTTALLTSDEMGEARLECEVLPKQEWGIVAAAKKDAFQRFRLFDPVLQAIESMVEWALPFDEPKTEEGQQDGKLRSAFRTAYLNGSSSYEFNGDTYRVFDGLGRPVVPQVCIDFITDAFDAATGGYWAPRGKVRNRVKGALHFPHFEIENYRSVEQVADFATRHPEAFDVMAVPEAERIPLRERERFFAHLAKDWARYRVGDVIFINGLRSDERYHYHSFFIVERDPVTAMPILVAANAGRPQIRTWEGEMSPAPRRYIVARVRARSEFLERAYAQAASAPGVPMDLAPAVGDATAP